jgi:hypothetical protein
LRREQRIPRPLDEVFLEQIFDYRVQRINELFAAAGVEESK